jgi:hypothetical protein
MHLQYVQVGVDAGGCHRLDLLYAVRRCCIQHYHAWSIFSVRACDNHGIVNVNSFSLFSLCYITYSGISRRSERQHLGHMKSISQTVTLNLGFLGVAFLFRELCTLVNFFGE